MTYQTHLYMICYPNSGLVLSHLSPEDFAFRYNYGSSTYHPGKLIFAELDPNYRHPYFPMEEALENFHPHKDGKPKATRYVSNYRVLEHVERSAIRVMYLANADGTCYPLHPKEYVQKEEAQDVHLFAEINPISMLTLSRYNMQEFGRYFTDPKNHVAVPRLLFLKMRLDIDRFLRDFEMNPFSASPLEGVHPSKLRDAILELRNREEKFLKGLTLDAALTKESYRFIERGLMITDKDGQLFFPMPELSEIEDRDLRFYKGM